MALQPAVDPVSRPSVGLGAMNLPNLRWDWQYLQRYPTVRQSVHLKSTFHAIVPSILLWKQVIITDADIESRAYEKNLFLTKELRPSILAVVTTILLPEFNSSFGISIIITLTQNLD
jgi:hypothetical protein